MANFLIVITTFSVKYSGTFVYRDWPRKTNPVEVPHISPGCTTDWTRVRWCFSNTWRVARVARRCILRFNVFKPPDWLTERVVSTNNDKLLAQFVHSINNVCWLKVTWFAAIDMEDWPRKTNPVVEVPHISPGCTTDWWNLDSISPTTQSNASRGGVSPEHDE